VSLFDELKEVDTEVDHRAALISGGVVLLQHAVDETELDLDEVIRDMLMEKAQELKDNGIRAQAAFLLSECDWDLATLKEWFYPDPDVSKSH
jgi:hypothetical protein